jgi:mannose-6-phosphate isomerase-like protein (cupin superfamily)
MRLTMAEGLLALEGGDSKFAVLFEHGSLTVEFYRPVGTDRQTPHTRDEVYVVASGHGSFFCGGSTSLFQTGDFLFVPAGVEHRFVEFSDDFATWVFFYGPEGGEAPGKKA